MKKSTLVTFSGGRDSSCASVIMTKKGYDISLFTFQSGASELVGRNGDSAPEIRLQELKQAIPEQFGEKERIISGSFYLLRKLAIENTNKRHVVYPFALIFSVMCEAVLICKKIGVNSITVGYSGYQAKEVRYIEQSPEFVNLMRQFLASYDIELETPCVEMDKNEIMDLLEKNNISSNSLENKSIFGGVYFEKEYAKEYWDYCVPICHDYIKYHTL